MKGYTKFALLLLSILLTLSTTSLASNQEFGGQFTRGSRCEEHRSEKLIIYVMDDEGNYYREVICQDGRVYQEAITDEEYIEYLYGTVPEGRTVIRDGRCFIISSAGDGGDNTPDRGNCEPNAHNWPSTWLPNSSWCYRNCTKCGERQTQGHGVTTYTNHSNSQHRANCSRCGYLHGYVAHVMKFETLPGGVMFKASCVSNGCGYSYTGYIV